MVLLEREKVGNIVPFDGNLHRIRLFFFIRLVIEHIIVHSFFYFRRFKITNLRIFLKSKNFLPLKSK